MSLVTAEIRANASEFYKGDDICQQKSKSLLTGLKMPNGLLSLKNIEEYGCVKETGFVWLKQKKKTEHKFEKIAKIVQYGTEVTAYVEEGKITKLTGVKAKELLMWVSISDICLDETDAEKIIFKTPAGLSRSFEAAAFQLESKDPKQVKDVNADKTVNKVDKVIEVQEI